MTSGTTDFMAYRKRAKVGMDGWLSFAAAPVFAAMALFTGTHDGAHAGAVCGAVQDASPLSGMVAMYLLMAAFHVGPWLRLLSGTRGEEAG